MEEPPPLGCRACDLTLSHSLSQTRSYGAPRAATRNAPIRPDSSHLQGMRLFRRGPLPHTREDGGSNPPAPIDERPASGRVFSVTDASSSRSAGALISFLVSNRRYRFALRIAVLATACL